MSLDFAPSYRQVGVTLLELMVTIAVIGILAAIATPYYGDYIARQRLVGAAEAVYAEMLLAKRAAVSNNTTVYLIANGSGTSDWCVTYSIVSSANAGCRDGYVVSTSNTSVFVDSNAYPNVIMSAPASFIGFVMPGLQTTTTGTISLSIPSSSIGDLGVSVGAGLKMAICGSVGTYEDC